MNEQTKNLHEKVLYPMVRVLTPAAKGSGTVIYSQLHEKGGSEYESLVLTCHHVISSLVKIEKKWSSILKRERKVEVTGEPQVETFDYYEMSKIASVNAGPARILAWDDRLDLALLRLVSPRQYPYVAALCPEDKAEHGIHIGDRTYCVGSALGEDPLATEGIIWHLRRIIDNEPYWGHTAPGIFGNSGGAAFLRDSYEFIGVPARIAVTGLFGSDAITHLQYFVPIISIYRFLRENYFAYVFSSEYTSKEAEEMRRKRAEREELLEGRAEERGVEEQEP